MKAGSNRMGKDTFELMKKRRLEKEWQLKEKMYESRQNWVKSLSDASTFLQEQNPVDECTVKEHGIVLESLRKEKIKKNPKKNKDLEDLYALL